MDENGRSWFYLTLWRGTPPEFTTEIDATIGDVDRAFANIKTAEAAESHIATAFSGDAAIPQTEAVGVDIITVTEVIWRVGR